jgi:hypothetical protein
MIYLDRQAGRQADRQTLGLASPTAQCAWRERERDERERENLGGMLRNITLSSLRVRRLREILNSQRLNYGTDF